MQMHYAFRQLAMQLVRAGLPVLRFDWHGTGDSAGGCESVSFQQWREDLQLAVQEMRDAFAVRRVSVVGFRLGASIAAMTSFSQPLQELVLWEPTLIGALYLRDLRERERRNLGNLLDPPAWWKHERPHELLGHTLSDAHYAEIQSLDLVRQMTPVAKQVSLIVNRSSAPHRDFLLALKERHVQADLTEVKDEGAQLRDDGNIVLASATLSHIVEKLKTV
jgi:pimeloyl-ACP methyl ester carboxylesterase